MRSLTLDVGALACSKRLRRVYSRCSQLAIAVSVDTEVSTISAFIASTVLAIAVIVREVENRTVLLARSAAISSETLSLLSSEFLDAVHEVSDVVGARDTVLGVILVDNHVLLAFTILLADNPIKDDFVNLIVCIVSFIDCPQDFLSFLVGADNVSHVEMLFLALAVRILGTASASIGLLLGNYSRCFFHFLLSLLRRCSKFVLVEEIDQVALAGLESHLTGELVHSELLDDLKQVSLRVELLLRILLQ